jgi:hypothetical protein
VNTCGTRSEFCIGKIKDLSLGYSMLSLNFFLVCFLDLRLACYTLVYQSFTSLFIKPRKEVIIILSKAWSKMVRNLFNEIMIWDNRTKSIVNPPINAYARPPHLFTIRKYTTKKEKENLSTPPLLFLFARSIMPFQKPMFRSMHRSNSRRPSHLDRLCIRMQILNINVHIQSKGTIPFP